VASRGLAALALFTAYGLSACSGGAGPSSRQTTADFTIESISVLNGSTWQINRPIDIRFSRPVDFSTVSLNTIRISDAQGGSATGTFLQPLLPSGQVDSSLVQFQPACPTLPDFSDAGLRPDQVEYSLSVLGSVSGGLTVASTDGAGLDEGALVTFQTPAGLEPLTLFLDTVPGPPAVILRRQAGIPNDELLATYMELGGDGSVNARKYFELNGAPLNPNVGAVGYLPDASDPENIFRVPLNKYSAVDTKVAVMIFINQPVSATAANINSEKVRLEYQDSGGQWNPIPTLTTLVANCTETGAIVRVEPLGLLPQDSPVRVNVRQGFQDITESQTASDSESFAHMQILEVNNGDLMDPTKDSDEILESFVAQGSAPESREDIQFAFTSPRAKWGSGKLEASFDFNGTGGPGADFDYYIPANETVVLSTVSATISGGPGGIITTTQTVINGVLDVRDLRIGTNAKLIFVGPNPVTILASGKVEIFGEISVRGSNNPGVGTLNTTNQPEVGASGNAGGGGGGAGSFLTSQSTPRGGAGDGAFNAPDQGGRGGESGYAPNSVNNRRPGGGGGGRFGLDTFFDHDADPNNSLPRCQVLVGLDAEYGGDGGLGGLGAISQTANAKGGAIGPDPFLDDNEDNNFFGTLLTSGGDLILGELTQTWAGSGGGGGGDAVNSSTFPLTPFNPKGDEKGSGGGGGGGGLRILAIEEISVGPVGRIVADGGHGGGGENTSFFNRVAGGSGGGTGGHIVLSSATRVEVSGQADGGEAWYSDNPVAGTHGVRAISSLGGQGGAGNANKGGAKETGATTWRCDRIPRSWVEPVDGPNVPPRDNSCYSNQPDFNDLIGGPTVGAGGDGGPGIIQVHVDNPQADFIFPDIGGIYGGTNNSGTNAADVSLLFTPPPFGWTDPNSPVDRFIPFFGGVSIAQSKWIPLGLARIGSGGVDGQVSFEFAGIDADNGAMAPGAILQSGSEVTQVAPIIGPDLLGSGGTPNIDNGGLSMVFDASTLPDIYKANSLLTKFFTVELDDTVLTTRFEIADSVYSSNTDELICTIATTNDDLNDFVGAAAGPVTAALVRHDFRMITSGIRDSYPDSTQVRILFDVTKLDSLGNPSASQSLSAANGDEFTSVVGDLNVDDWDFVRFRVEFNLNAGGMGGAVDINTPRPAIEFLRLPFLFN
jgi:hypothetical protein